MMNTGRRQFLATMIGMTIAGTGTASLSCVFARPIAKQFDFGIGGTGQTPSPGYIAVGPADVFTAERGWGWLETQALVGRDRKEPSALKRDLVFGTKKATFRIAGLNPGRYRLTLLTGDFLYGDHITRIQVAGLEGGKPFPVLQPAAAAFATLTATLQVPAGTDVLDIVFDTNNTSWVVNSLSLEPATEEEKIRVTVQETPPAKPVSRWGAVQSWEDPTAELLAGHRKRVGSKLPPDFRPTGLQRQKYLDLIHSEIEFWKAKQNPTTGAIIDPYRKVEIQYSTPAFAHAASTLVVYAGRKDLIEPAAKALDWSARTLSERKAATGHEDFFAPLIAHAIRLLKPHVPEKRSSVWEADIRRFDPFRTYRMAAGSDINWNVVAASGEAMFQQMGLRDKGNRFVEVSFAGQGAMFGTPYGLYLEGPLAYDHFPRLWAGDLIARGYKGPYYRELTEVLRRASITSLFMQSPWGELPAGGRSAHHQWNEAEQCVTYEIYAARALEDGDKDLAAYFKRAAHLALASMYRWIRPSGEMQIVKNWVEPAQEHGYERYSAHSQYNLLAMSMLAIAYEHAKTTEKIAEKPAPADIGGYVLQIKALHKVFANIKGTYIEIDTAGDHHYDATGLIRIHMKGVEPQSGVSDSLVAHPAYHIPKDSPVPPTTGCGIAWQTADGNWRTLGELSKTDIADVQVASEVHPDSIVLTLRYTGALSGPMAIEERYELTPGRVALTTRLPEYAGAVRYLVPILADNGKVRTDISVKEQTVSVVHEGVDRTKRQTFNASDAASITIGDTLYADRNGWARLMAAEYAAGAGGRGVTLTVASE